MAALLKIDDGASKSTKQIPVHRKCWDVKTVEYCSIHVDTKTYSLIYPHNETGPHRT